MEKLMAAFSSYHEKNPSGSMNGMIRSYSLFFLLGLGFFLLSSSVFARNYGDALRVGQQPSAGQMAPVYAPPPRPVAAPATQQPVVSNSPQKSAAQNKNAVEEEKERTTCDAPGAAEKEPACKSDKKYRYYMRLDYGFAFSRDTGFKGTYCNVAGDPYFTSPYGLRGCVDPLAPSASAEEVLGDFDQTDTQSIGLGVNLNSHLRSDITLTQRLGFNFQEDVGKRDTEGLGYWDPADNIDRTYSGRLDNTTLMANLYLDFLGRYEETKSGVVFKRTFSPYIGLGVGVSENDFKELNVLGQDVLVNYQFNSRGAKTYDVAWMATLGGSLEFVKGWMIDINYKFMDLGKVMTSGTGFESDDGLAIGGTIQVVENPMEAELQVHEFMAGIRYEF